MTTTLRLAALLCTGSALLAAGCGEARPVDGERRDCPSNGTASRVHPCGIADPADPDFHGTLLRGGASNYQYPFDTCRKCHGADLAGGTANRSCFSCHKDGPDSFFGDKCTGCHGAPPETGAHVAHSRGGKLAVAFDCSECHVKPKSYTDVGHIFDANQAPLSEPAMSFGALAMSMYAGVTREGPPAYDRAAGKCANVYCHGGALPKDTSATVTSPAWKGGETQAACGTCHGLPPATPSHTSDACGMCHPLVADSQKTIVNPALHIDGKVALGRDGTGRCDGCHGSGMYGAPRRDLSGHSDTSAVGVGAHAAHLNAEHHLRGPIACGDCHLVPDRVDAPGHIDHPLPAEVFPARPGFTSLATSDGAKPAWDHNAATCANVYCHGGGTMLSKDQAGTPVRSPQWTAGSSQARCGGCHGLPPSWPGYMPGKVVDGNHDPAIPLTTCFTCHGQTIDSTGAIKVTGAPGQETSTHINGHSDGN